MPFLSSLIFTGSRVGGLREVKSQSIESGLPYFPDDFSGSDLGQKAQASIGEEAKAKWDRTPPAKRISFETLGTRSPFEPDWNIVCGISQTQTPEEGFEQTQRMEEDPVRLWLLYGQNTREIVTDVLGAEDPAASLLQSIDAARLSRNLPSLNVEGPKLYLGALVLVQVTMCGRGTPTDMSAIYDISKDEAIAWSSAPKHPEKEAYEVCLGDTHSILLILQTLRPFKEMTAQTT
jgi:ribonuclease P/MRP protein subunit POP1